MNFRKIATSFLDIFGFLFPYAVFFFNINGMNLSDRHMLMTASFFLIALRFSWPYGVLISLSLLFLYLLNQDNTNFYPERLYPFVISLSVFIIFFRSWLNGENILLKYAEKFVKISSRKKQYLERVTGYWACLTGLNTLILMLFLFFLPTKIWAFYAGFLSYLIILTGVLFTWFAGFRYGK